jgi:type I restriction enzyme S subunit
VDIASGEFANTGTKTSMLVFEAGVGSTETITFYTLSCDVVCSTPVDRCRQKSFSLNSGVYIQLEKPRIGTQHNMVKLRDILVLKTGEYVTKTQQVIDGFPVYGGGNASYLINMHNREDKLVVAKDGVSEKCIRFVPGKFFLNHHGWTFDMSNNLASESYVNQWLLQNQHVVYRLAAGTAQKGINQQSFYDIEIPLPPFEVQERIVKPIDAWMGMAQTEEKLVDQLEKAVMCQIEVMNGSSCYKKVLELVSNKKYPKHPTSYGKAVGKYRFHTGADSTKLYSDTCDVMDEVIIINRTNGSGKCNMFLDQLCSIATQTLVISANTSECLTPYLFYTMQCNKERIEKLYVGGNHKNISLTSFMDLDICVAPVEEQQTLQRIFDEIKNKKDLVTLYKRIAQEYIEKNIPKC